MPRLRRAIPAISFAWAFGLLACGTHESTALDARTDHILAALGEPDQGQGQAQEQGQAAQEQQGQAAQEQQEQQDQRGQQAQQGQQKFVGGDVECAEIHAKLVVNRAALQATTEWQALEKTKEYQAFDAAANEMQKACDDGHDADHAPSAECVAAYTKFKVDLVAMKTTPEWSGVTSTPAYTVLKNTYDEYHAAGCGHAHTGSDKH